jgi:hypothetical protein
LVSCRAGSKNPTIKTKKGRGDECVVDGVFIWGDPAPRSLNHDPGR